RLRVKWSDGQQKCYCEFSYDGFHTTMTKYGSGRQFIYSAPVSVVGRRVRFSVPSANGPNDADFTVSADNLILEGTITTRNTGQTQPYRLHRVYTATRKQSYVQQRKDCQTLILFSATHPHTTFQITDSY